MFVNLWDELKSIYDTTLLYLFAFFSLMSPGTVIWKLFSTRQGKTRLANRDLICDHHTLMNLEKSSKPLDQFTNALSPFVPLFLIENDQDWKHRREVFIYGNNLINKRLPHVSFDMQLPEGKGNILWDLFQLVFRYSFELSFNRKIHDDEFKAIYPGLVDINKIIKRFSSSPNMKERDIFYQQTLKLIKENDQDFLFHHCESFFLLDELNQVSSVAEDFLTTISVQCTDLICHLLILYSSYPEEFHTNFDYCFNETLRLYPLTDLWVRQGSGKERGWIASLVQLNRNGWTQCDDFLPQRWSEKDHPPLLSWGFDSRRCPAQKFATDICKRVFQTIIHTEGFWVEPAKNFDHERTFPYGCQLWIGYGLKPDQAKHWTFPNKLRMQWRRWTCSFNLHQYGPEKAKNATLTKLIAEIINEFDLAVIQEMTDVSLKAPFVLHDALNRISESDLYSMIKSERTGRSFIKEQYIFFNRPTTSGVELVNAYTYNDTKVDHFERPPFIGTFRMKKPGKSGVQLFTIMNVHLKPKRAFVELLAMRYVIEDFILSHPQYFNTTSSSLNEALEQNVINATLENKSSLKTEHPILIVGDFNADCETMSAKRQELIRTIGYVDFQWIITNEAITNTKQTCTYDRIFVNGDNFFDAIVPNSNTTVNFRERFGVDLKEALKISDHFPVKFDIHW